ncbi:hypothetical protein HZH68_006337 [Vespula germanica]|uniref:Uncharacterized protein n=1 Tax=Vespula germanica TaxID=30212 RepID=A0A834KBC5_VESGE|nr:hypothetical protein HZH68_006337 [Vespula germanica]
MTVRRLDSSTSVKVYEEGKTKDYEHLVSSDWGSNEILYGIPGVPVLSPYPCDRLDCNSSFMSLQRGGILTKNTEEKRRCHTLGHLAVTGLARIMIDRSVTKGRSEVSILLHSTLYTAPSLVGTHSNGMPNITEPTKYLPT